MKSIKNIWNINVGFWSHPIDRKQRTLGAIHSTKIPTGPTGKIGPPQMEDPFFSKLFWLDRTDPLSFGPKFPEILVEWIAPLETKKHKKRIEIHQSQIINNDLLNPLKKIFVS